MPPVITRLLSLVAGLVLVSQSFAADEPAFRFAGVFTNHAVLQRDQPIPVWGFAEPEADVTIRFAGQEESATADAQGKWRVELAPVPASREPLELTATCGEQSLSLEGVLVGEVWLCSGQSNMAMIVDRAKDPEAEKADADLPQLRVFQVDRQAAAQPQADVSGEWVVSSADTAGRFSATAFFFGREIHREIDVPVGLIVSAWSGSAIEAWTSREVQEAEPALGPLLDAWATKDAAWTPEVAAQAQATYEKEFEEWRSLRDAALKAGEERPRPPRRPIDPRLHHHHPAVLYNGMIAPLVPYAIRGAIWYQGETNGATPEAAALYKTQLPLLVNDWRSRWGQGDFPMAWMQLPTISANRVDWAPVREAMRLAHANLPNTGMAVTLDLGEERLLHPLNKQGFARRLALWARAEVYGESELAWSGPLPEDASFEGDQAVVTFDHAAEGLVAQDGSLTGFELVQENGDWVPAEAQIKGSTVLVSTKEVTAPRGVRYAWGNHPTGNLRNAAGLPASPFALGAKGGLRKAAALKEATPAAEPKKVATAAPTKPPLEPVEIEALPDGMERLDLYLLMGQSNMKGRGEMPEEPLRDPQIVMMHKGTDKWFLARHPLHLVGDPETFKGHDNAGVGPGLAFGQAMAKANPDTRIGLIPCAVGGTRIALWQPGAKRYEDMIRRAKLALQAGPKGKTRIVGAIWLQGEADSREDRIPEYPDALKTMIESMRKELNEPDLPFVASTILELRDDVELRKSINEILLSLPELEDHTACVDARDLEGHIGDMVHIDTPSQNEIGQRMAEKMIKLQSEP